MEQGMNSTVESIKKEVGKVIVGHEHLVDAMLIALLCEGHLLVEGVPGLAKTTAINALALALGLAFKRVQFTPDLLPSDITGTEIYDQKSGEFKVKHGPVFTNLLLADEINRAPAKVQSALLEVMQEKQVTIAEETYRVDRPFLVLATQNPVEQEGAYNLPEAQLDRFMMKLVVGYNTPEEELEIARRVANDALGDVQEVASKEDIFDIKESVRKIHIDEEVEKYIVDLVFATREPKKFGLESIEKWIMYGASPRASIDLYKASRAQAYLRGKDFVSPVDIAYVAKDILRHRIILSYEAEAEEISSDLVIDKVLETVAIP
jgi:MoxR-like ATPase